MSMTPPDATKLERSLEEELQAIAPRPRPALLGEVMRRVASTPQRSTTRFAGWRLTGFAAAAVAGILVGASATLLVADRPDSRPPPSGASAPPSPAGAPATTPAVSSEPSAALPTSVAAIEWEMLDLPDPAEGMLGGGRPEAVVVVDGGYVAIGTLEAGCVSDITEAPPGCEELLMGLTAGFEYRSAVVWTSTDGRAWEPVANEPTFERAGMHDAATDGSRVIVTGEIQDPPDELGTAPGRSVVWLSDDGRTWELVDTGQPVPEHVAWTGNGYVGSLNTEAGPQFLTSDDGRAWQVTGEPGDHGQGRLEDMVADPATGAVVAVGYQEVVNAEGLLDSSSAAAWRSLDGQSWERAPDQDALVVGPPGGAYMFAVAHTGSGWVALGRADNDGAYDSGAWTSADGLAWTRLRGRDSPIGADTYANAITWTGSELVAFGTISGRGGSTVAAWVSADGSEWSSVPEQPGLSDGSPTAVTSHRGTILAVGIRSSFTDHWVPVVYLAEP